MSTEFGFIANRLWQLNSAIGVKPLDLLKAMVYEIEKGALNPDTMVVVFTEPAKTEKDGGEIMRYRANLTRSGEVLLLDQAHFGAMRHLIT